MELILVRHGLPVRAHDVGDAAHGGHAEPPPPPAAPGAPSSPAAGDNADPGLAPEGVEQAVLVARWLAAEPIDAVYASPLRRARETAAALADALGQPVTVREGLEEWDRDAAVYVHMEDLKARDDPIWQALAASDLPALGIDPSAFQRRVVDAIDGIAAAHRSQRVAVVCHGGVINAYTASVIGIDRLLWFSPDYAGISRVRVSSAGVRSVVSINETGHLRPAR